MKITIEPTRELFQAPINGATIPIRIWQGRTAAGVAVEAYVLAITPVEAKDHRKLRAQMPDFMVPSSDLFTIDLTRP